MRFFPSRTCNLVTIRLSNLFERKVKLILFAKFVESVARSRRQIGRMVLLCSMSVRMSDRSHRIRHTGFSERTLHSPRKAEIHHQIRNGFIQAIAAKQMLVCLDNPLIGNGVVKVVAAFSFHSNFRRRSDSDSALLLLGLHNLLSDSTV